MSKRKNERRKEKKRNQEEQERQGEHANKQHSSMPFGSASGIRFLLFEFLSLLPFLMNSDM